MFSAVVVSPQFATKKTTLLRHRPLHNAALPCCTRTRVRCIHTDPLRLAARSPLAAPTRLVCAPRLHARAPLTKRHLLHSSRFDTMPRVHLVSQRVVPAHTPVRSSYALLAPGRRFDRVPPFYSRWRMFFAGLAVA